MTHSPDNPDWPDLIAGYALGDLTPTEIAAVKQQLRTHPSLGQELRAYQETLALLPEALPRQQPSAQLKAKLLSAASAGAAAAQVLTPTPVEASPSTAEAATTEAETFRAGATTAPPPTSSSQWPRWITGGAVAIAAGSLATLGFITGRIGHQTRQITALQQQVQTGQAERNQLRDELIANQAITEFLHQPQMVVRTMQSSSLTSTLPVAQVSLLAQPGEPEIMLVAKNLPPLPNDQIYRLWAVIDTTIAPIYCGQFRQDDYGVARWVAPASACTANPVQLLITVDAPDSAITSLGAIVMQSELRLF